MDANQKEGQIAHIDRDKFNNDLDNLAFLCLDHHDIYDSVPRLTKRLQSGELKHYRSELYAYLGSLQGRPPELVLGEKEFRKWVKRRQRMTLGWSLLATLTAFMLFQAFWNPKGLAKNGSPVGTMDIVPEPQRSQEPHLPYVVVPVPKPAHGKDVQGKNLTSSPIDNQPNEESDKLYVGSDKEEPGGCSLSLRLKKGKYQRGERSTDEVIFKFPCSRSSFKPGDVFYKGSIIHSEVFLSVSSKIEIMLPVPGIPLVAGTASLRWENAEVRYLGLGQFAATEVWSLTPLQTLPGGHRVLSLQPAPMRPWGAPGFDLLGDSVGLNLLFSFLIASTAVAWSSRVAWEHYLVRRYHLTVTTEE